MIRLILPLVAMFLSACTMEGLAGRLIPDEVRADAERLTDEIMAGEFGTVRAAFPDQAGPEFEAFLSGIAKELEGKTETAREIIGAQASAGAGTDGPSRTYALVHEVQIEDRFVLVSQVWKRRGDEDVTLFAVDITDADTSTAAQLRRTGMIVRVAGSILLAGMGITPI